MIKLLAPKDGFVTAIPAAPEQVIAFGAPAIQFDVESELQERRRAEAQMRLVESFGQKLTAAYVSATRVDLESALAKACRAIDLAAIIHDAGETRFILGEVTLEVFVQDHKALFEAIETKRVAESKLLVFDLETASQRSLFADKLTYAQTEIDYAIVRAQRMTVLAPKSGIFHCFVDVNSFAKLGDTVGEVE